MRKHWSVILACGAAILLAWPVSAQAQSTHPHTAPGATGSPAKPKSSAQPKISDAQLEATIRAKFAKSKSANKFKVRVQGGVATIEGNTEVVQHKAAATRMAKVAGAVAVNNKVVVSDAAKQKAAGNLEEGRRRVQVKRSEARSQP